MFNFIEKIKKILNNLKTYDMKKVTVRFTVMTNNNVYWATSLKAAVSFCKANDFVINRDWYMTPSITDQNQTKIILIFHLT